MEPQHGVTLGRLPWIHGLAGKPHSSGRELVLALVRGVRCDCFCSLPGRRESVSKNGRIGMSEATQDL